MSLFGFLGNFFSLNSGSQTHTTTGTDVYPVNGLPMIGVAGFVVGSMVLTKMKVI